MCFINKYLKDTQIMKDNSNNLLGCDGLLRDSNDTCSKEYVGKISSCDTLHIEMWGMYIGMDLSRRQGITRLQVEGDSKVLVDMATRNCNASTNILTLIRRICDLKNMSWQFQINYTWREGNRSADWLVNVSFNLNYFDLHIMETFLERSKSFF
jgi:ribonuclease HI